MQDDDISDLELERGALWLFCPPEGRHLFLRPTDAITLGSFAWSMFDLDREQQRQLIDRARRLELLLRDRGR